MSMAFVSGYQHDVFIRYAHIDDEPSIPGDNATRWVSTLSQILQTRLDQKLGEAWSQIRPLAVRL